MKPDSNLTVALITGAASGIGQELAHLLAKDQYELVLVDQDTAGLQHFADHLRSVHNITPTLITQELSQPDAAQRVYDAVRAKGIQVDILINDAGFGEYGPFLESDVARNVAVVQTNITALIELTYLFGRDMVQRGKGRILQLASTAAYTPSPKMAVYSASKSFVLSFSEALYKELQDTGVTVTALCPGATDTNFFERAGAENTNAAHGDLADPKVVAKDGYEALMKGEMRVISGITNKVQAMLSNITPDGLVAAGMGKMFDEKK
ncbi:SDR family oxidoreductase [Hymenobacter sp. BT635]|uniref:SDR family oxidoreductase n=1 Tax=Hymenobacter nitidus TaxID=2880929 RepID=A0ABS8AF80_9BACT|nr:SDR family oxidoreductase [Hymenobacter nitidus]MCB2378779.1 SDR family oxidoreductase [Hymenobacter nitidus]